MRVLPVDRFRLAAGALSDRSCRAAIRHCVAQRVTGNAKFRAFEDGREDIKGIYGTYGYTMLPNFALTYTCYAIAQTIERTTGEVATPTSTGPMTNGNQISLRHSAVAAGLGEFGWHSIVLTPEFGSRALADFNNAGI